MMVNRIYEFDFESLLIPIAPSNSDSTENVYTVIVGKNGVGKSRLLAAIARSAIRNDNPRPNNSEIYDSLFQLRKVIAASTSPFDKFPLNPRHRHNSSITNYRYIGMRGDNFYSSSSSIALISSVAKGLLENIVFNRADVRLRGIFEALNFAPVLEFIFKPSFLKSTRQSNLEYLSKDEKFLSELARLRDYTGLAIDERYYEPLLKMPEREREEVFAAIAIIFDVDKSNKAISLKFDFSTNQIIYDNYRSSPDYAKALFVLLNSGLMRLMDLRLDKNEYGLMSLKMASSGEQCMLVLMLGIAGHITDNSLVLIDEPEISLHPTWQEDFMKLLMNAFSGFVGCQFIIATHSPQIISRLRGDNCFVTSLTRKELYPSNEFSKRSADYQLAELFDAPGTMNEYISRLAFNILAKVKSAKHLSSENLDDLQRLVSLASSVDDDDPTKQLISSVKGVCDYYANH